MRKITIKELADEIKNSISSGKITTYYIKDNPFCVYEGKRREKTQILDVQEQNQYDTIYEELKESLWSSKKVIFWNTDSNGTYSGKLIIDSTVIVEFKYSSLEGQGWLYKKYKEE